jgi:hypothetical protein
MEIEKFQFNTDFQENLLQYTVSDKNGYRALQLYEDSYFTLLEHQIIAKALKDFFKKKKRVPQSKALLKEQLRKMFMTKDFINALSVEDKSNINRVVNKIYRGNVKDGDELFESTIKFAQYVKLKSTIDKVNLNDFNQYEVFSNQVRKAITIGTEFKEGKGVLLIQGIKDRHHRRKFQDDIIPSPFWQLNKLTNGGGYSKGTVIVLIGPEKEFKTGMLINIARNYIRCRKKVLYIDFENGEDALALRLEQSIMNLNKKSILSGENDIKVQKQFRKYQRLGGEIDIKRMPAYTTTCDHIQTYIDSQYNEYGIRYNTIICDYAALGGAISGNKDDTQRISDFYVDFKNLVDRNEFETGWTANHIQREALKRFKTKFLSTDTAKCIDIVRHVDVALGFNRSEFDIAGGLLRLQVIDQRDGVQDGLALFKINYETQKATEVSKSTLDEYYTHIKQHEETLNRPPVDDM